jgi:ABC-type Fe3+ transport system substrate-binding protein
LIQPYKVSTWDSIPADAKDAEGYWYGDYYGVLSFLVNTDVQPEVPQDWADLLDPKYNGQVALSGDPRASNQAIQSVFAAALANGGSLDDAQPGLDFFAQLNSAGNLVPLIANNGLVATGETAVRITWDYNALAAIDSLRRQPRRSSGDPRFRSFRWRVRSGDQRLRSAPERRQVVDGIPLFGRRSDDLDEGLLPPDPRSKTCAIAA